MLYIYIAILNQALKLGFQISNINHLIKKIIKFVLLRESLTKNVFKKNMEVLKKGLKIVS